MCPAVCREHQFKDRQLFYRFHADDEGYGTEPGGADRRDADDELPDVLALLAQIGPDAMMRMILRKPYVSRGVQKPTGSEVHGLKGMVWLASEQCVE